MFSTRASLDLTPNPLTIALGRVRAEGRRVLDLTESNPTRAGVPYDEATILSALAQPASLRYEPTPFGITAAREVIARDHAARGVAVDASSVVLTASTSEAYAFLFKLLADPGDDVLVPSPSYPLFEHLARLESVRAIPYRLAYDGAWHIDVPALRTAVTSRTRAIVTVSPNNPTGSYLKRDELDAIASLGLPIVSDEVFAEFPLREDPRRVRSALDPSGAPLVFALGGLSKAAALPQAKLAWILVGGSPREIGNALARLELIADAFLSVGTAVQHALPKLMASRHTAATYLRNRCQVNLARLRTCLESCPVSVLDVEGGWYATLRLPKTQSEESWALSLLEEEGVYLHPGYFFDYEGGPHAVASLIAPEDTVREGAMKIARCIVRHTS
jgi:alanine-synthesizing transaminase